MEFFDAIGDMPGDLHFDADVDMPRDLYINPSKITILKMIAVGAGAESHFEWTTLSEGEAIGRYA